MKEIELRNVKGCVDYSPREQYIRNYISDTLKKVFEKYGFKPLQTPLLCYYDLLALKYDEENDILKEVYKVTDQGNRNLALRYDLTVPFAKYIAMNPNTKMPFKRYEIGDRAPGTGRYGTVHRTAGGPLRWGYSHSCPCRCSSFLTTS